MIEYLALAAEITAVLLIISIAYPTRFKNGNGPNIPLVETPAEGETAEECDSTLQSLRVFAYQAAALQVEKYTSTEDWLQTDSHREISKTVLGLTRLLADPNFDSLCRLPTTKSLENQFSKTFALRQHLDLPLSVAVMSIDGWSEINEQYGQVVGERLLRDVSNILISKLSSHGTVVRYSDYAFGVGLFGLRSTQAIDCLLAIKSFFESNKISIGENQIQVTFSMATTVVRDEEFDSENHLLRTLWERLDDGVTESITGGGNQLHSYVVDSQSWVNQTVENSQLRASQTNSSDLGARANESTANDSLTTKTLPNSPASTSAESTREIASEVTTPESPVPAVELTASPSQGEDTNTTASVASSDDIAALFAAQKAKPKQAIPKAKTDPDATAASVESSNSHKAELEVKDSTSAAPAESTAAKASADDIAALFASMKKSSSSKSVASSTAPKPPDIVGDSITAPPVESTALEENSMPASDVIKSEAAEQPKKSEEAPSEEESLVASIDDISALFAAAQKNYKKNSDAKKPSSPAIDSPSSSNTDEGKSADKKSKAVQSTDATAENNAVNADDIASLFASMRK